ncbi:hypothetical protein AB8Q18_07670 [Neisseriaceae bacterium CLB008]
MNKWLILMLSGTVLSGCLIRVVTPVNLDAEYYPPPIQGYQKTDTIGHTDPDRRWHDLQTCGVQKYNGGRLDLNGQGPEETVKQVIARRDKIYQCMEAKGYVIYSIERCIKNRKPTGLCN